MTGRQRNDDDIPAALAHFARADDRRLGVIAALHENIGPKQRDELERRVLIEDDHGIDRLERRQHVAALRARCEWAVRGL